VVTLRTESIGEAADYKWFDKNGNLISEEMEFDIIATEDADYKLGITALSDGYKDYATASVKIIPAKIASISPNPTSNDLTIVCVFNKASAAYVVISDYFGMIYNEFPLPLANPAISFSTYAYPIGTYIVKLVCEGKVVDTKTFVRQ